MQTALGHWMNLWASGLGMLQTGVKLNETMVAAKAVIESRTNTMAAAVRDPLNGDYAELSRMVLEKGAAFALSAKAASGDLQAIQKDLSANSQLLTQIASGRRLPMPMDMLALFARSSRIMHRTMGAGGNALAPIHRRVVANEKRLKRKR
jgi:purine-nucleoside phosphorylase